ncbi:MAG: acetate--CoA ligase family protein [Candidatus Manganitrophus sp.]|nr:MAG: acetate--CoA ligase family protein [Candidatus Manganitrophus sp.]
MNIHEYQAKALFAKYQIPVPNGKVAFNPQEAQAAADTLATPITVVKAQIHAGGRGKAGGVKLAKKKSDVAATAQELLGKILVTHQTGPQGQEVKKLLVEEGVEIAHELYVSWVADRGTASIVLIASTEGGMDIEEVAAQTPEKIVKLSVDPVIGFQAHQGRTVGFELGLPKEVIGQWVAMLGNLYRLFIEKDASLVEINPLVVTKQSKLIALDAKMNFDDNALFRHDDIRELRDLDEEDPLETRATAARPQLRQARRPRSAAWSTARASRWRRWTSSSSPAASRPTSSTSAAAPRRRRSPRPSRSCSPIRT